MAKAKTSLSKASFVTLGYGQVEPNHLSAQATRQIYAQLPAEGSIDVLENGQFVKYDYRNGVCNFTGAGEWMLVFNEVKTYEDEETDADFAMIKGNYAASVYSPIDGSAISSFTNGMTTTVVYGKPKAMPAGSVMTPRVFKTNVGDIFTTNCVALDLAAEANTLLGKVLTPGANGILAEGEGDMQWQVVKVYDLADRQRAVKLMRIA